jgi:hypothetical protein
MKHIGKLSLTPIESKVEYCNYSHMGFGHRIIWYPYTNFRRDIAPLPSGQEILIGRCTKSSYDASKPAEIHNSFYNSST